MAERRVLLLSGGLDSVALAHLERFDVAVHVVTETDDNVAERRRVFYDRVVPDLPVELVLATFLRDFELPNKIVPFRNHLLVVVGAMYGNRVAIGATSGDTTRDKDEAFASLMSRALTYFAEGPADKVAYPPPVVVELPLRGLTKREVVAAYLAAGHPAERLVRTTSCYEPVGWQECGRCRSCLRKYVALCLNGVTAAFAPPTRDALEAFRDASRLKGRGREVVDIDSVLERV